MTSTLKRLSGISAIAVLSCLTAVTGRAGAATRVTTDRAAAIVIYPYVSVDPSTGRDTVITLANASDQQALAQCILVDSNGHCVNGSVCQSAQECPAGQACTAGYSEVEFFVSLTPRQPLIWAASTGLDSGEVPLPHGVCTDNPLKACVVDAQCAQHCTVSNAGTGIPPVPEPRFQGFLHCIAINASGVPIDRNAFHGTATLVRHASLESDPEDAAAYTAIGIPAIPGANNGDGRLMLGGSNAEYAGCPAILAFHPLLDAALDPVTGTANVYTTLVLVSCSNDFFLRLTPTIVNQFSPLVDENALRYVGQAETFSGHYVRPLTRNPQRDLLGAAVLGTLTGRFDLRSVGAGVVGLAIEEHRDANHPERTHTAVLQPIFEGSRSVADVIVLPGGGGTLVTPVPTAAPTSTPTPASVGPEITFFGLAAADNAVLAPAETNALGDPVYVRPRGFGFLLVIEARRGLSGADVGIKNYDPLTPAARPDLQIVSTRDLGNGSLAVCDDGQGPACDDTDPTLGGVPAMDPPSFDPASTTVTNALNDIGCRFRFDPAPTVSCTRGPTGIRQFVSPLSFRQACTRSVVGSELAFPPGDTTLTVQWRDTLGNIGTQRRLVIRVP